MMVFFSLSFSQFKTYEIVIIYMFNDVLGFIYNAHRYMKSPKILIMPVSM